MNRLTMQTTAAAIAAMLVAAPAVSQEGGRRFSIPLTGAEEVPGPGDPDGTGSAELRINPGQRTICYTLTADRIGTPTGAHIHEAPAGAAGPIVVHLKPPADGRSEDCVSVTRELALEIIRDPSNYYVNVHNREFPKGAVRGQLRK